MSKVSGDVSMMPLYREEIQLKGRDGIVVNAEASIYPEKDAQIPKRVLDDLWKIIKAVNLEDAITIPSLNKAAISSTMTPQVVMSYRILCNGVNREGIHKKMIAAAR